MPKKPLIKYTSRDFDTIKNDLVQHAKRYYPNSFNDFTDSSFGGLVMDSVAYVGDILSFYLDFQTNESFLETSMDYDNVRKIASQMGYNFFGNPSSYGIATFFVLVPANSIGLGPDTRYLPIIATGTRVRSDTATFILTENVNFGDPSVEVVAARFDEITGKPTHYALKAFGQVRSGVEFFQEIDLTDPIKFLRVQVGPASINEIISVFDSEGHQYYEVENLSQEVVYLEQTNPNAINDNVRSIMKPFIASRRFVVVQDSDGTYLQFGYGSETQIERDGLTDPSQVVLKMSGKNHVTDTAFDPNIFLGTDKFGIAPSNTTLKVSYLSNDSLNVNVAINGLIEISNLQIEFPNDITTPNISMQDAIAMSAEVTNESIITVERAIPTSDEIRYRAYAVFSAQNRTVTKNDYEAYVYQMPTKFGKVSRVNVVNDPSGINKRLAMYVISKDNNDFFVNTNGTVKNNLKTWLNKNKMLTDQIDVFDARIINVGFNYKYTTEPSFSKTQVAADVNLAVKNLFTEKMYIGEPIYITKIYQTINRVQGVVDTLKVEAVIKQSANYSNLGLEVDDVLSKDGTFLKCPKNCVFEIKFPDSDLKGTVL
tara:strand:- start:390 stop:2180 length:1791 start_codon:yes stop_codon:yes gene_type:complete